MPIIDEILTHMRDCGGGLKSDWYVGIAEDPNDCLFNRHGVNKQSGAWIYRDAVNDNTARQIERLFVNDGYDGGPGGGSRASRFIYAFRKTATTRR